MRQHEKEPLRTDRLLTEEEQQAVLVLASRLQREYDEGATLADLIQVGQEAGISRQAVEEAYLRITSIPSEQSQREQMGRSLRGEVAAIQITLLWALATWLGILALPADSVFGSVIIIGSLALFPLITGLLVRRIWLSAGLAMSISMNLLIAFSLRFGPPQGAGARNDLLLFVFPVIISFLVAGTRAVVEYKRRQHSTR